MAFRQDATELGDARRRVEALVGPDGQRSFEHPWELRAFAMAVAAYHNGQYEWSEFQLSLIDSIKRWETDGGTEPWSYYEHWLEALESVLAGNGGEDAPEHVYTVKFTNEELWGAEAAEPNGVVYFDVWEPYIVPATSQENAA